MVRPLLTRFFVVVILGVPTSAFAQITFFGPTPYLSSADSPFEMPGMGSTFFLEDFEDGDWHLPAGVTATPYVVRAPGMTTDSVDMDDGVLDGRGENGHSLVPTSHLVNFTNPLTHITYVDLMFDHKVLGFLPNAFGFVWTDGVPGSYVTLGARDENFNVIGGEYFFSDMGMIHDGETSRDRFVGFVTGVPFRYVYITNYYRRTLREDLFEIDHLQFGLVVPEPSIRTNSWIAVLMALGAISAQRIGRIVTHKREVFDETAQSGSVGDARRGGAGWALRSWSLAVYW